MEQAGIQLNNGLEHGEEGRGFVRMNFAVTRATLDAALDRIEKIFLQILIGSAPGKQQKPFGIGTAESIDMDQSRHDIVRGQ